MKPRAGFWSVGFAFDGEHRAELMAHGLDEQTIACVQGAIDYVKSYSATNPPSRKERRELPAQAHKRLAAAAETLALLDPETVDSIEALAYPQAKSVPLPKLKVLLDAYAAAAGQLAEFAAKTPQRGPDATKDTHIVVMIGAALRSSGVRLDDSACGPFVRATETAFAALGTNKKDVRNDVRRALQILDGKGW